MKGYMVERQHKPQGAFYACCLGTTLKRAYEEMWEFMRNGGGTAATKYRIRNVRTNHVNFIGCIPPQEVL